jgi:hypothetical protein
MRYIANALEHLIEADGPEGGDDDRGALGDAYIAAEAPAIPIWRLTDIQQRICLGKLVKQDYRVWFFEPSEPETQPEDF